MPSLPLVAIMVLNVALVGLPSAARTPVSIAVRLASVSVTGVLRVDITGGGGAAAGGGEETHPTSNNNRPWAARLRFMTILLRRRSIAQASEARNVVCAKCGRTAQPNLNHGGSSPWTRPDRHRRPLVFFCR